MGKASIKLFAKEIYKNIIYKIIPPQRTLIVSVYISNITHKTDYQILLNVTWRKVKCSHRNCFDLK